MAKVDKFVWYEITKSDGSIGYFKAPLISLDSEHYKELGIEFDVSKYRKVNILDAGFVKYRINNAAINISEFIFPPIGIIARFIMVLWNPLWKIIVGLSIIASIYLAYVEWKRECKANDQNSQQQVRPKKLLHKD